jgi:hypothetical protein
MAVPAGSNPSRGAAESRAVQKVRKKLEKIIKEEKNRITPEALKDVSQTSLKLLARHQEDRMDLSKREVEIFDENNSSPAVKELLKKISAEFKKPKELPTLKKRVKEETPPAA